MARAGKTFLALLLAATGGGIGCGEDPDLVRAADNGPRSGDELEIPTIRHDLQKVVLPTPDLGADRDDDWELDRSRDDACEPGEDCEPAEPLGPPYPIVLAHGFFGFEHFAGIEFISYFFGVRAHLMDAGEAHVFTPPVDPFNDSTTRGLELLEHVESILAYTGHEKVNIIGHSQGGLDGRVVAHLRPDLVASVTTFATPHHGTLVADITLRLVSHSRVQEVTDALVRLAGMPLWDAVGEETSYVDSMRQLSRAGMEEFNATYTDQPGVRYFSLTGRSGLSHGLLHCGVRDAPDFVQRYNIYTDPVDPLLLVTHQVLAGPFNLRPNDGMVRVEDAVWGEFLGCVPADHLDEVGHLFGAPPGLLNPWRHKTFYEELVAWLRAQGL